jgi:hypothetical protein
MIFEYRDESHVTHHMDVLDICKDADEDLNSFENMYPAIEILSSNGCCVTLVDDF